MTDDIRDDKAWESLCRGCGSCCFEKIEDQRGTIFYTMKSCRYLDVDTRKCRIYDNRFSINPECVKLTEELVPTLRWLPPDCGYVSKKHTEMQEPDRHRPRKRRR